MEDKELVEAIARKRREENKLERERQHMETPSIAFALALTSAAMETRQILVSGNLIRLLVLLTAESAEG